MALCYRAKAHRGLGQSAASRDGMRQVAGAFTGTRTDAEQHGTTGGQAIARANLALA